MSQRSGQTAGGIVVLTVLPSSVLCIVGPAYEGVIPTRVAYVWEVVGVFADDFIGSFILQTNSRVSGFVNMELRNC